MKSRKEKLNTFNATAQRIVGSIAMVSDEHISIDVSLIPPHARDDLSRFALALTKECFARPGAEEQYQAWLKERRKRMAAQNLSVVQPTTGNTRTNRRATT